MSKRITTAIFLSTFFFVSLGIYWLRIGGVYYPWLRDSVYVATSLLSVVSGIFALRLYGFQGARAKTLLFLTIGMACWFIGEVIWNYYELILNIKPFPSIGDMFYLLAYPLVFFGLLNEIYI